MKVFSTISLILICSLPLSAQTILTENSLSLKPEFEIGDKKVYYVKDEYKIESSPLFPVNAAHEYEVCFTVLDTTDGYEIAYVSKTLSSKNSNWPLESLKAKISSDLNLVFKIKKSGMWDKIFNLEQLKSHLLKKLDSAVINERLSDEEKANISILRNSLKNKQSVELFIKPLVLFFSAFSKPIFQTHKTFHQANRINILNEPGLPGVLITKLKKRPKGAGQLTLEAEFIGNKDSAAKYYTPVFLKTYADLEEKPYKNPHNLPYEMKNNYEVTYVINPDWQLQEVNYKSTEFFVDRLISRTTMKLIDVKNQ